MTEKEFRDGAAVLNNTACGLVSLGILSFVLPVLGIQLQIVQLLSKIVPAPGLVLIALGIGLGFLVKRKTQILEKAFRAQREAEQANPQIANR